MTDSDSIVKCLAEESAKTRKTVIICSTLLALVLVSCSIPSLGLLAVALIIIVLLAGTAGYILARATNKTREAYIKLKNEKIEQDR